MTAATVAYTPVEERSRRRLRGTTALGAFLGVFLLAYVLLGPLLLGHDANANNLENRFAPPSSEHLLGTDDLGRDLATRLAVGGRTTLLIALGAVALSSAIAIPLGLLTGYVGRWTDLALTRVVDLFFAIPTLLIAIGIVGLFGASLTTTVLALGLAYWPFYTRLIRSTVVSIRSRAYIDAALVLGAPTWRVIVKEVVPGLVPLVLVQTTVMLGFAILDEAGLGFLGLGVQPPEASWGSLLAQARQFILSEPQLGLIAGVPILIAVFAINLLADSLRDALDPRTRDR